MTENEKDIGRDYDFQINLTEEQIANIKTCSKLSALWVPRTKEEYLLKDIWEQIEPDYEAQLED